MFQNDFRPPKHVLHLVWSVLGISTAIKTALKEALYDFCDGAPAPLNSQLMEKVNHYNWTKQIKFSMGPSVKFILAIIDSISPKKMGVNFFLAKLDTKGGGRGPRASCQMPQKNTFFLQYFC